MEELKAELDGKGIAYKKDIQVGIMVETAAASLIADIFAKEADCISAAVQPSYILVSTSNTTQKAATARARQIQVSRHQSV